MRKHGVNEVLTVPQFQLQFGDTRIEGKVPTPQMLQPHPTRPHTRRGRCCGVDAWS